MATHRQLPNNTDIAPFQEKGRWYRAFIEKDESGNSKLTYADSGLPAITPTGYGFTMEGQKNGKNFHLISASCNPGIGTGTAGDPAFFYPTIGQNYTADGSQYVVDFNKPETNVSLSINGTAATASETINGLVQKNIDLSATVESGGGDLKTSGYYSRISIPETGNFYLYIGTVCITAVGAADFREIDTYASITYSNYIPVYKPNSYSSYYYFTTTAFIVTPNTTTVNCSVISFPVMATYKRTPQSSEEEVTTEQHLLICNCMISFNVNGSLYDFQFYDTNLKTMLDSSSTILSPIGNNTGSISYGFYRFNGTLGTS